MKSNSDADWERQVEIARAEINQLEEQRANAKKFLGMDVSAFREVRKQFVFICLSLVVIFPVLLNPYTLLIGIVILPFVLLVVLWIYHFFNPS